MRRTSTRGCTQTLLGARVHRIHFPFICEEGDAAQRAHCVSEEEGVVGTAHVSNAREALMHTCSRTQRRFHREKEREPFFLGSRRGDVEAALSRAVALNSSSMQFETQAGIVHCS